jgi:EAL domain-containing protein (putative c-di-GMP-specific phosphodiesterase class I)
MPSNILELISKNSLVSHFQPVVSVKKRAVVGFEALARGLDGPFNHFLPDQLFSWAQEASAGNDLDDLCIASALNAFTLLPNRASLALFLNLDATRLARGPFPAGGIRKSVEELGLRPQDIVLEFSDLDFERSPGLKALIESCQSFGFSVALDDLDGSPASLRRMVLLKPNLIKVDDHLVQGLAKDTVQQTLVRGLASLSRNLGALTVAEGVESEEDASMAIELGADLLQGHHYGRPAAVDKLVPFVTQAAVDRSAMRLKAMVAGRTQARQRDDERHLELLDRIKQALSLTDLPHFTATLEQFVNAVAILECLYIVDPKGTQETPTVVWRHQRDKQRSRLFVPAEAGADHSLKDYYLELSLGASDPHVSEPYVSLATGNMCRTLTTRFNDSNGKGHILCMDTRSS